MSPFSIIFIIYWCVLIDFPLYTLYGCYWLIFCCIHNILMYTCWFSIVYIIYWCVLAELYFTTTFCHAIFAQCMHCTVLNIFTCCTKKLHALMNVTIVHCMHNILLYTQLNYVLHKLLRNIVKNMFTLHFTFISQIYI